MTRFFIILIVYILLSIYAFQSVKTITKVRWIYILYIGMAFLILANVIYQFFSDSSVKGLTPQKSLAAGFMLSFIAFNLVLVVVMFAEDIFRFISALYAGLFSSKNEFSIPSRRKFISAIGLGLAAIPFASLLYGMYKGKYNYRVLKYTLHFEDLPEAFDGYKITQLSDIHAGSFDDKNRVEYAVNLVNEQQSDVILFTGDMVNDRASELEPWKNTFSKLKAKDGKFSVLGNHDYGDYVQWESKEAKIKNLEKLKSTQKEMGFKLLLNEHTFLEKGDEKIALVGVENWGKGGFIKAGNLKEASLGLDNTDFKVLMSHDPSHWDAEIVDDNLHYHLTLSGHTHGMQFGIEIPGWIKWSPVKWRYKQWAGIYQNKGQYINVNRGFGFIGYPGRVGIWPEITVIELKKGKEVS